MYFTVQLTIIFSAILLSIASRISSFLQDCVSLMESSPAIDKLFKISIYPPSLLMCHSHSYSWTRSMFWRYYSPGECGTPSRTQWWATSPPSPRLDLADSGLGKACKKIEEEPHQSLLQNSGEILSQLTEIGV